MIFKLIYCKNKLVKTYCLQGVKRFYHSNVTQMLHIVNILLNALSYFVKHLTFESLEDRMVKAHK